MKKTILTVFAAAIALVIPAAASAEEVTVEEQVIYDTDGRKVTVTGYETGWLGPEIMVLVENDTESSFTLQIRDSSVNGIFPFIIS